MKKRTTALLSGAAIIVAGCNAPESALVSPVPQEGLTHEAKQAQKDVRDLFNALVVKDIVDCRITEVSANEPVKYMGGLMPSLKVTIESVPGTKVDEPLLGENGIQIGDYAAEVT